MKYLLSVFLCVFILTGYLYGQSDNATRIHYVNAVNVNGGGGTSWSTAFNHLQDALDAAASGDEIWVAAGTYKPTKIAFDNTTEECDCGKSFLLNKNNIKIFGGFPVTGNPSIGNRNWLTHKTILSGDIDNNDQSGGEIIGINSFHVVINLANNVLLDGFTISGGDAIDSASGLVEGHTVSNDRGGGIYNIEYANLILQNSIVKANRAINGAGVVNETGSSSEFVNVLICGNFSTGQGAGMYNFDTNTVLTNVTISGNTPDGIFSENATIQLFNTIIAGNESNDNIDLYCTTDYNHTIIGDLFYRNNTNVEWGIPPNIFMHWVTPTGLSTQDNYRLAIGSYAIDAGNNSYSNETTDLNGKPRIMDGTVDLGACEFYFMTMIDLTVNGLPFYNDPNVVSTDDLNIYDTSNLKICFYDTDGILVNKLEPGEYRVSVDYPKYNMTYYNKDGKQASTWKDASPIHIEQAYDSDQHIQIVVTLIPERSLENGTITISGILGLADEDIHKLSKIRPISNLNGNVSLSKNSALKSGEGDYEMIKTIQTTDGSYTFTNLPEGYYQITADIAGYDPGTVDIHIVEGMETVNFIVNNDTKTIIAETLTEAPSWQVSNLKVYPNPVTDVLHVSGLEGNYTVKIMNILGQYVYSTTGSSPELLLNVGHFPSGMYFLRIESNQKATTQKIIKQ